MNSTNSSVGIQNATTTTPFFPSATNRIQSFVIAFVSTAPTPEFFPISFEPIIVNEPIGLPALQLVTSTTAVQNITQPLSPPPPPPLPPPPTAGFIFNFVVPPSPTTSMSRSSSVNTTEGNIFPSNNATSAFGGFGNEFPINFSTPDIAAFLPNFLIPNNTMTILNNTMTAENVTNSTAVVVDRALFGFPAFCSSSAPKDCFDVPLNQCSACNMASAGFFAFIIALLALAIISSNLLVMYLFAKDKSTFTGSYGRIKASLAFTDMLTGIVLLAVTLPNFSWTIASTAQQVLLNAIALQGSPQASAGGVLYILIYTASLYHLVFLGQQRLYAIKWPISYKQQPQYNVYTGLAVVWVIALLCAVAPLWFPDDLVFGYQHLTFLFNLTLAKLSVSPDLSPLIAMVVVVFIVPYLIMTVLTVVTGFYVSEHMTKSSKIKSTSAARNREVMVFATMAAMQLGFTITLVPLVVVVVLSYTGSLNTTNIAAPYVVCFYLSMTNSLVNVLVYSVVDKKFRKSVRQLFISCCPQFVRERMESTSATGHKTHSTAPSSKANYSKSSSHVEAV